MSPTDGPTGADANADVDAVALRTVDRAKADLRRGLAVAVTADDGDAIVVAAEMLTAETLSDLRLLAGNDRPHLALTDRRANVLHIKPTGYPVVLVAVTPDMDAATLHDLADPTADLDHPLRGPFQRNREAPPPAAAAAIALCKLARLLPAAIVIPVESADEIAARRDLSEVSTDRIAAYETSAAFSLRQVGTARVPLEGAENVRIVAFRPTDSGIEHLAILIGEPRPGDAETGRPVLVRLHSECFTGDLLGSLRCDCGDQLRGAIAEIAREGSGILLYLAQEGRGIGLINKLRAYRLQDQGFDTIEANERLGFEADERVFLPAAEMLKHLGFERIRLLTNNPAKVSGLGEWGITVVERVPHAFPSNAHNEAYLATKKKRSGHYL